MANDHKGTSGNLGDPVVSIEPGGWRYRLPTPDLSTAPRPGPGGTNHGRNDGIAKRRKRSAAKWAAGSRSTSEYRGSGGTNPRFSLGSDRFRIFSAQAKGA